MAGYEIYRYTEEITEDNFPDSVKIAEIPPDKEFFIDYPRENTDFYYTVLAKGFSGKLYKIFIPFRNKSVQSVSLGNKIDTASSATVTGMKAVPKDNSINITFSASRKDRELTVFRSTSPITSAETVKASQVAGVISSANVLFTDYAIPGVPYYFAVLDTQLAAHGLYSLVPGQNTTTIPAEIQLSNSLLKLSETAPVRARPLPTLVLSKSIETGKDLSSPPFPYDFLKEAQPLKNSTEAALKSFISNLPSKPHLDPQVNILDIDKAEAPVGESYLLFRILSNEFRENNWKDSEKLLTDFLTVKRANRLKPEHIFTRSQILSGTLQGSIYGLSLCAGQLLFADQPWLDACLFTCRKTERSRYHSGSSEWRMRYSSRKESLIEPFGFPPALRRVSILGQNTSLILASSAVP